MKPHLNKGRVFLVLGLSGLLAACAGPGPRPEGEMQTAQQAIERAQANDARQHEPVLLNQAQNKVADAQELIKEEEYREARRTLEQAAVDAELAMARTETEQARIAVEQLNQSIEALRKQLDERQQ
jgi:tRNA G46 methylase TrmB